MTQPDGEPTLPPESSAREQGTPGPQFEPPHEPGDRVATVGLFIGGLLIGAGVATGGQIMEAVLDCLGDVAPTGTIAVVGGLAVAAVVGAAVLNAKTWDRAGAIILGAAVGAGVAWAIDPASLSGLTAGLNACTGEPLI